MQSLLTLTQLEEWIVRRESDYYQEFYANQFRRFYHLGHISKTPPQIRECVYNEKLFEHILVFHGWSFMCAKNECEFMTTTTTNRQKQFSHV